MTKLLMVFLLVLFNLGYCGCSNVPEAIRKDYASGMFEAFITQSYGKSTIAFYQFDVAREKAKKVGENPLRLIAIERLFGWYRTYASSLDLYHKRPEGTDRINGEYKRPYSHTCGNNLYESEWGKTPEQARLIREFMFGVGEIISAVFCATISGGTFGLLGGAGIGYDGLSRIYSSLNSLWALHQAELIALKEWENSSLKPAIAQ